jgi:diguanylate cyclase (GGDEF)-like protein
MQQITPQHASNNSPYAGQIRRGFKSLHFMEPLEGEFREAFRDQNIQRGRISAGVALVLSMVLISADSVGGSPEDLGAVNAIRLMLLVPLMLVTLLATYHPTLQRYYEPIMTAAATLFGLAVIYATVEASINGATYVFGGLILTVVCTYLFVGLRFNTAVIVSLLLFGGYAVAGLLWDVPLAEHLYKIALLATACLIGALGSYTLEHALRTNFLEAKLLNQLAERDGLTGLYNRRIFDDYMERLWRQSRREQSLLQVILIDIDYFKVYNDLYGHQAGDDCLKRVAECIAQCAKRPFDFCARYGGEEFALILYDPPRDYAEALPERLRRDIQSLGIIHDGSQVAGVVTASIGVSLAVPGDGRSLAGAIQLADEALYQAKEEGRNRVVFRDAAFSHITTGSFRVVRGGQTSSAA